MADEYFLNPKTELRGSSVEGQGLFAKGDISKGENIHIAQGRIVLLDDQAGNDHSYQIDETHLFVPLDPGHPTADWFINHSCDPNTGCPMDFRILRAMRDIKAGEEITYDYAMTDSDPNFIMQCKCGSPRCRKTITGNDWRIPELQKRYEGFFSKSIQEKINGA